MRCCGRSSADVVILITLFVVTMYSIHSYYIFLFPHAIEALELAFLQPFRRGVTQPTSSSPLHLKHLFNVSPKSWILFGVSVFLFVLALWAYVAAAITDAGRVPLAFRQRASKSASLALKVSGALRMCPVCVSYKPQRTHHCSRCGRCVLKYDHHCPWLGRCVGFFNYKLYLLTVLYTFIFTLWVCSLLTFAIGSYMVHHYEIAFGELRHRNKGDTEWCNQGIRTQTLALGGHTHSAPGLKRGSNSATPDIYTGGFGVCPPFFGIYVCFSESFVFLVLTASLLKKHWRLARHNLTTLDLVIYQTQLERGECIDRPVNPFDIGVKGCLQQVFGDGDDFGEHVHPNFLVRWFFRLLPLPAYPEQPEFHYASAIDDDREIPPLSGGAFIGTSHAALKMPNYGTTRQVRPFGSNTRNSAHGEVRHVDGYSNQQRNHIPRESRSLQGLCFPTVSPPPWSTLP